MDLSLEEEEVWVELDLLLKFQPAMQVLGCETSQEEPGRESTVKKAKAMWGCP